MKVAVVGFRGDKGEWEAVQEIPKDLLPPLTPEQRKVAEEQHIPEELYQRSALAGRRTGEKLLKKAEWLAKLLQRELTTRAPEATIKSVVLDTWKGRFEIAIELDGTSLPLHVDESTIENLFDLGSAKAEHRLSEMLEASLRKFGVL